jgi:hypothetical protein
MNYDEIHHTNDFKDTLTLGYELYLKSEKLFPQITDQIWTFFFSFIDTLLETTL